MKAWMRALVGVAAMAAMGGPAAPAAATVTRITYTGYADGGLDRTGAFGARGPLAGVAFTVQAVFDDSLGTIDVVPGESSVNTGSEAASPGYGSITMGERTVSTGSNESRQAAGDDFRGMSFMTAYTLYPDDGSYHYYSMYLEISALPPAPIFDTDYRTPLSYQGYGSGFFYLYDITLDASRHNTLGRSEDAFGYLTVTSMTITVDSSAAVPEADAWALMIVGFGGVGGMIRRRRREKGAAGAAPSPVGWRPVG